MGGKPAANQVPKIDFSGLDPAEPESQTWSAVRTQVTDALISPGCFEAIYPQIPRNIHDSLFNTGLKNLFALPIDTKTKNVSNIPFHAYLARKPDPNIPNQPTYESLAIIDAQLPHSVQNFTNLMWPNGNPNFCETVQVYAKKLAELEQMAVRMVMESFGAGEFYESKMLGSTRYSLRMSEYTAAPETEEDQRNNFGTRAHTDSSTLGIVSQNQVDGLEIETRDGDWVPAAPSPGSFIVLAGDGIQAWTNGRVRPCTHRVVVRSNEPRRSTILFSYPNDETVLEAPSELVDADHPRCFKPYNYLSYVNFCITEKGLKAKSRLEEFCGLVN